MAKKVKRTGLWVWKATSTNIIGVGSRMGTESTSENWSELFSKVDAAKAFCEKDYRKQTKGGGVSAEPIEWEKDGRGWTSGDLRFVEYDIQPVKVR